MRTWSNAEISKAILDAFQSHDSLSDATLRDLITSGRVVVIREGESIANQDEPVDNIYFLLSGALRVQTTSELGREQILTLQEPNTFFGLVSSIDLKPNPHDIIASGATHAFAIETGRFRKILRESPDLCHALLFAFCGRLRSLFSIVEHATIVSPKERLRNCLVFLAEKHGTQCENGKTLRIVLTQDVIAGMIGTSRQTTNKLLKQIEDMSVIRLRRGWIEVLDLRKLRSLS